METGEEGGRGKEGEREGGGRRGRGVPHPQHMEPLNIKQLHNFCTSVPAGPKYVFQVALKG